MACAIFYTCQTSGDCAGACACDHMHQNGEDCLYRHNLFGTQTYALVHVQPEYILSCLLVVYLMILLIMAISSCH